MAQTELSVHFISCLFQIRHPWAYCSEWRGDHSITFIHILITCISTVRRIFTWDRSCGILNIFCIFLHLSLSLSPFAYVCICFAYYYAKHMQRICKKCAKNHLGWPFCGPKILLTLLRSLDGISIFSPWSQRPCHPLWRVSGPARAQAHTWTRTHVAT